MCTCIFGTLLRSSLYLQLALAVFEFILLFVSVGLPFFLLVCFAVPSSFFLLPSSFFLLPSSFLLLFGTRTPEIVKSHCLMTKTAGMNQSRINQSINRTNSREECFVTTTTTTTSGVRLVIIFCSRPHKIICNVHPSAHPTKK